MREMEDVMEDTIPITESPYYFLVNKLVDRVVINMGHNYKVSIEMLFWFIFMNEWGLGDSKYEGRSIKTVEDLYKAGSEAYENYNQ